jgi:hypothetical protein
MASGRDALGGKHYHAADSGLARGLEHITDTAVRLHEIARDKQKQRIRSGESGP